MPETAREGWGVICRGETALAPELNEEATGGAALRLAEQAAQLGVRPPDAGERAGAMGVEQHAKDLALSEHMLARALGDSFDEDL
eukprot:6714186-Alexandrium_andersonii.AAC.1